MVLLIVLFTGMLTAMGSFLAYTSAAASTKSAPDRTLNLAYNSAALVLTPVSTTVSLGQTFSVTVQVHTTQAVDGGSAYVDFDPAQLQVASVTAGSTLPMALQNQVDNVVGRINFAAGALSGPYPSSDFVLATVVFTATGQTVATPLTFATVDPRQSDVQYDCLSV